jgi:hypothetical protein
VWVAVTTSNVNAAALNYRPRHLKSGFGASVPMSASCTGSVSTGEIQQLTVNGKTIL